MKFYTILRRRVVFLDRKDTCKLFHDALSDCDLADMGYEGDRFTWQRGRVRERRDRGVANGS